MVNHCRMRLIIFPKRFFQTYFQHTFHQNRFPKIAFPTRFLSHNFQNLFVPKSFIEIVFPSLLFPPNNCSTSSFTKIVFRYHRFSKSSGQPKERCPAMAGHGQTYVASACRNHVNQDVSKMVLRCLNMFLLRSR